MTIDEGFKMAKRDTAQRGFVNFPVKNPRFNHTGEGGMYVKLLVEDETVGTKDWMLCCGGYEQYIQLGEAFVGNYSNKPLRHPDLVEVPLNKLSDTDKAKLSPAEVALWSEPLLMTHDYMRHHFPHESNDAADYTIRNYNSIPYLCAMTIASTKWSGYDEQAGEYWHCTLDDLTEDGRALLAHLEKLYPNCQYHLQTWLDT